MTRRRQEELISTIVCRNSTPSVANISRNFSNNHTNHNSGENVANTIAENITNKIVETQKRKYNLRPRKIVSYVETDEFVYTNDAKDPDYVPYVYSIKQPHLFFLSSSNSSIRNNISSFITEVNASAIDDDGIYRQIGQNNNGISHRWALRSSLKK